MIAHRKTPTVEQVLKELKRESGVRERVYPHWIAKGKITQQCADNRRACLYEAIELIEKPHLASLAESKQPSLFVDPGDQTA